MMGLQPADERWRRTTVGEVYRFTSKPRGLKLSYPIDFIPMEAISERKHRINPDLIKKVTRVPSGTYVENGDLILAKITPSFENGKQGVVAISSAYAYATTEVIPIQGIEGVSEKLFLAYWLKQGAIRTALAAKMEGSTGRQRLSKGVLSETHIDLPGYAQQKEIARILAIVEDNICSQERAIVKLQELKKSTMHYLFTRGTQNEKTKQTEIGEIPESWRLGKLEDLMAVLPANGIYKPLSDYGSGTRIIRINDFELGGGTIERASQKVRLSTAEITTYQLAKGDIVLNRVNSLSHLGKLGIVGNLSEPHVFESNMMRFRLYDEKWLSEYVVAYLSSDLGRNQILEKAKRAVAQASVNQGDVQSLLIPLPSLAERLVIVELLKAFDACYATASNKLKIYEKLFNALLDQLMTGKIEVS